MHVANSYIKGRHLGAVRKLEKEIFLYFLQSAWHDLRNDLVAMLMPLFLMNHPNSMSVLHYAWNGMVCQFRLQRKLVQSHCWKHRYIGNLLKLDMNETLLQRKFETVNDKRVTFYY